MDTKENPGLTLGSLASFVVVAVATAVWAAPAVAIAQDTAALVLAPARSGLLPVPLPRLDSLEAAVAQQITKSRESFADAATARADGAKLAAAYGSLGQLYHAYEFLDAAEACYRNAAQVAPDDFRWLHLLGRVHQQRGRFEEAARAYTAALAIHPDDHVARIYLGDVYLRLNRLAEARAQFQTALPGFPAAARNGLGEVALHEGKNAEAIRFLEEALARAPQASRIHYSLAMAYRAAGRLDQARAHLRQLGSAAIRPVDPLVDGLQQLLRGSRVHLIQGRLSYQAGEFKAAAEAFARAVDADPSSVDARVNLGAALAQMSDFTGAIQHLEAALRLDAQNALALRSLGAVFALQDRHVDAIDRFRAALAIASDDVEAHRGLVRSLLRLGRGQEAIDSLLTVSALDPADEDSRLSLTILLADRGRYREARDLLDEANRLFPDHHRTATTLARLLATSPDLGLRDGRRALQLAQGVYDLSPTPVNGETVVLSLAESGRCEDAAVWQRRVLDAARKEGDVDLAARLGARRYDQSPCRADGDRNQK